MRCQHFPRFHALSSFSLSISVSCTLVDSVKVVKVSKCFEFQYFIQFQNISLLHPFPLNAHAEV